jgi:predicted HicB family RNase H-like nuclease
MGMTANEKQAEVKRKVERLFAEEPDWVTFYREVFGLRGLMRQLFPTREALAAFEQSEGYQEMLQMLTRLRERGNAATDPEEPTRVITVRLPKSLHEALRIEAHEHRTSMNKLCVSKLLQFIDNENVPSDQRWGE